MAIVTLRSHPSKIFLFFSSDDELDVLLNGTPDQNKKLIREYLTGESESSSADEFDKEMEAELTSTVKAMEGSWAPAAGSTHWHLPSFFIVIFTDITLQLRCNIQTVFLTQIWQLLQSITK